LARTVQTARDKPLYGTVARPLLDFSERGVGTRPVSFMSSTSIGNTHLKLSKNAM